MHACLHCGKVTLRLHAVMDPCVPGAEQTCRYATGIDTGCVLGGQRTAVVLPPLTELRRRGLASPPQAPVTLEAVGGVLVSVQAKQVYRQDDNDE